MSDASAFSKPCRLAFENGRLFGSAQTRSGRAMSPEAGKGEWFEPITDHRPHSSGQLLEREDIELPSLARIAIDMRVDASGSAHTCQHGHILLAIRSEIRDRRADHS